MPKIFDTEQGSSEWFAMRRGVITATRAQALLEKGKGGGFLKTREHAIAEIAMERLNHSGKPQATGAALRRGHEFEDEAIDTYIFQTGQMVDKCGFMLHGEYDVFGCSPDGLVGQRGMVQIKVPTSVLKHVEYLETGSHVTEYQHQLFHEMYVADREWTDIVSYNPESPPELQLAIVRLSRPTSWKEYETALMAADNAIEDMVQRLSAINTLEQVAA